MAKRVLVVEDNELNLKLFCDLLRAHDFAAEPVADGREAVAKAREFEPDLIVMDIQMPHVTGFDLIREMKRDPELRAIPIMAVTAYAGREDEERIRTAGANAYVSKPISLARFMEEVRALVPAGIEPETEAEAEAEAEPEVAAEPEVGPEPEVEAETNVGTEAETPPVTDAAPVIAPAQLDPAPPQVEDAAPEATPIAETADDELPDDDEPSRNA